MRNHEPRNSRKIPCHNQSKAQYSPNGSHSACAEAAQWLRRAQNKKLGNDQSLNWPERHKMADERVLFAASES